MKTNRRLFYVLATALVLVWGYVAWAWLNVREMQTVAAAPAPEIILTVPARRQIYRYQKAGRDPFAPPQPKKKRPGTRARPPAPPPVLPQMQLVGLLGEAAMIEAAGTLHFLKKGDELLGARLLAITPDSITFLFKRKRFTLKPG